MAKLPLDRYLQWGSGSGKSLTLNQVTSILLDVKHTGDWKHALRHVPRRKLNNEHVGFAIRKDSNHLRYDTDPHSRSLRKSWKPKLVIKDDCSDNDGKDRLVKVRNILKNE